MIINRGFIEQASLTKHVNKELWSFVIKGDDAKIMSVDSLSRHYPDPILSEKTFTIVTFKDEGGEISVEVKLPREDVPTSLSDVKIFEGKSVVVKKLDESL